MIQSAAPTTVSSLSLAIATSGGATAGSAVASGFAALLGASQANANPQSSFAASFAMAAPGIAVAFAAGNSGNPTGNDLPVADGDAATEAVDELAGDPIMSVETVAGEPAGTSPLLSPTLDRVLSMAAPQPVAAAIPEVSDPAPVETAPTESSLPTEAGTAALPESAPRAPSTLPQQPAAASAPANASVDATVKAEAVAVARPLRAPAALVIEAPVAKPVPQAAVVAAQTETTDDFAQPPAEPAPAELASSVAMLAGASPAPQIIAEAAVPPEARATPTTGPTVTPTTVAPATVVPATFVVAATPRFTPTPAAAPRGAAPRIARSTMPDETVEPADDDIAPAADLSVAAFDDTAKPVTPMAAPRAPEALTVAQPEMPAAIVRSTATEPAPAITETASRSVAAPQAQPVSARSGQTSEGSVKAPAEASATVEFAALAAAMTTAADAPLQQAALKPYQGTDAAPAPRSVPQPVPVAAAAITIDPAVTAASLAPIEIVADNASATAQRLAARGESNGAATPKAPASAAIEALPIAQAEPAPEAAPAMPERAATVTPSPLPLVTDGGQLQMATFATPATQPSVAQPVEGPQDFATLVSRLEEAREAASPHVVRTAINHADFGQVSLQFRHDDNGLAVTMANADPGFAGAVQAAASASLASNAGGDDASGQQQQPPQQQYNPASAQQAQTSGSATGGNGQNQQARADQAGQSTNRAGGSASSSQDQDASTSDQTRDGTRNGGGIYA